SQVMQGITTVVLGNDGTGPYAVEDFMAAFDEKPPAMNIVTLTGHGTIRRQIMGTDFKRPATPDEIEKMAELLARGMREGAFGMSVDPRSDVESYAAPGEFAALARTLAGYGGVYVTKLRDETKPAESVNEAVQLGKSSRISVQLSDVRVQSADLVMAL